MRVCQKSFPTTDGFYIDGYTKSNLDIAIDCINDDQDFVFIVSGNGKERIGKSHLAQQIGFYITSEVNRRYNKDNLFTAENNFVFRGTELIEKAKNLPKYSVVVYDEAGADMQSKKVMHLQTQAVLDFFRECGQLNLFLILCIPDYFELPKGIALSRSCALFNVQYKEKFIRGKYRFFGDDSKKMLYLTGKKWLDYNASKADFSGDFFEHWTIDEIKYKQLKMDALAGRKRDEAIRMSDKMKRMIDHRKKLATFLYEEKGMDQGQISEILNVTQSEISKIIKGDYT